MARRKISLPSTLRDKRKQWSVLWRMLGASERKQCMMVPGAEQGLEAEGAMQADIQVPETLGTTASLSA